jgi:hypothetical protein
VVERNSTGYQKVVRVASDKPDAARRKYKASVLMSTVFSENVP